MSQAVSLDTLADIDRQIAALHEQRRQAALAAYPSFEEFARVPWRHAGAGVIRSASGACVVLLAESDFQCDDYAAKKDAQNSMADLVVTAVNGRATLMAAVSKALDADDRKDLAAVVDALGELRSLLALA